MKALVALEGADVNTGGCRLGGPQWCGVPDSKSSSGDARKRVEGHFGLSADRKEGEDVTVTHNSNWNHRRFFLEVGKHFTSQL